MSDQFQQDFSNQALDFSSVFNAFEVRTNWCVITGAACSGKTTMIDQLAGKGYRTSPEPARQFVERELAKGFSIEEIRADQAELTCQIYAMMLEREGALPVDDLIFLDRAIPDAPGFYRFAGMDPNEVLHDCFKFRYAAVFLLNRLPYQIDGVRVADDETAAYFEDWTLRDYTALGYDVVRVPVLPHEERLAFVLERLSGLALI